MKDTEPLRIYADKDMTASWAYVPLLYPFWGMQKKNTTPYLDAAFSTHGWDPEHFILVDSPEKAEYIVFPHEYWWAKKNRPDLLSSYAALSEKYRIPLLLDSMSDADGEIILQNAKILRTNQYRFALPENEITAPYAVEDLLEAYCEGRREPRKKSGTPSIGFVGFAEFTVSQRMKLLIKELPIRFSALFDRRQAARFNGRFWRERSLGIFSRSGRIQANFITRPSYSGHVKTVTGDMKKNRTEFVQNLLDSDYSLVVKGDPNASQRFYEILSVGRIPVVIDTACVFPLEHLIEYRDFCVFIDHKNLKDAPDILADFHESLPEEKYQEMQEAARHAYEQYLRTDSFSAYLPALLRT